MPSGGRGLCYAQGCKWVPMISASRAVDRGLNQLLCHGVSREQQKTITSSEQRDSHGRSRRPQSGIRIVRKWCKRAPRHEDIGSAGKDPGALIAQSV
jgi:hypothetical protein